MDTEIEKKLKQNKIIVLKFLNKGSFSECYLGIKNNEKIVIKMIADKNINNNEVEIL
jgi:hypothetical protein